MTENVIDLTGFTLKAKAVQFDDAIEVTGPVVTTDLDAGVSDGTAGTVDIFPGTGNKGKLELAATANSGNTTNTITNAAQAGARTWTIPDTGADASFIMSKGPAAFETMFKIPVAAVDAAGNNQGNAAALVTGLNVVALADDTKGVILPAAAAGLIVLVKSTVADKILKVYPNTSDAINAIVADSPISLASGPTPAIFVAADAVTWYTFPLLPS